MRCIVERACRCALCASVSVRPRWFLAGIMWGVSLCAVAYLLLGCGRGPVCQPRPHGVAAQGDARPQASCQEPK